MTDANDGQRQPSVDPVDLMPDGLRQVTGDNVVLDRLKSRKRDRLPSKVVEKSVAAIKRQRLEPDDSDE